MPQGLVLATAPLKYHACTEICSSLRHRRPQNADGPGPEPTTCCSEGCKIYQFGVASRIMDYRLDELGADWDDRPEKAQAATRTGRSKSLSRGRSHERTAGVRMELPHLLGGVLCRERGLHGRFEASPTGSQCDLGGRAIADSTLTGGREERIAQPANAARLSDARGCGGGARIHVQTMSAYVRSGACPLIASPAKRDTDSGGWIWKKSGPLVPADGA